MSQSSMDSVSLRRLTIDVDSEMELRRLVVACCIWVFSEFSCSCNFCHCCCWFVSRVLALFISSWCLVLSVFMLSLDVLMCCASVKACSCIWVSFLARESILAMGVVRAWFLEGLLGLR